jgi:hypothetical protein
MQSPQDENLTPLSYANESTHFATLADLATLIIRVCAAITFFQFVPYVPYFVMMLRNPSRWNEEVLSYVVTPIAMIAMGCALWFFAEPLSRYFAPPRSLPMLQSGRMLARLKRVAFATAGLVLLMQSLPDFVYIILAYFLSPDSDVHSREPVSGVWIISNALRVLLSLWLVIGNAGVQRLWRRVRSPNFQ